MRERAQYDGPDAERDVSRGGHREQRERCDQIELLFNREAPEVRRGAWPAVLTAPIQ